MPKGEFGKRADELLKKVGTGKLEGKVVVDQVYAEIQHEALDFQHTGGGPKFLTNALVRNRESIMKGLAHDALDGRLPEAMARGMEQVSKDVYRLAPHEFNDLRNSAHPTVKDRGRFVYNRPPIVKRLSKSALRAKDRARGRK